MKTHMIICNEADYLRAHLTVIASGPRRGSLGFQKFKKQIIGIWRKWVVAVNGPVHARIQSLRQSR